MTALITQSNYLPWKGYIDAILAADVLVVYDDMQYTKRDWRNRNKIKTDAGLKWITIPVEVKGKYHQRINEVEVADEAWRQRHLDTIKNAYQKATHFDFGWQWINDCLAGATSPNLTEINTHILKSVIQSLGGTTEFRDSREFNLSGDRTEKLVNVCLELGAAKYITGPAAKAYMEEELFVKNEIELEYLDYTGYPEYPQIHGAFEHGVSILDMFMNLGEDCSSYLKSTS